jgi:hypothetical protein
MSRRTAGATVLAVLSAVAGCGVGGGSGARVVTEVLVDGLNGPTAVVAAADGSLLVAESGAGRIVSIDAAGEVTPFVTGFDVGTYTPYTIGPLGLLAAPDGGWIVGEGGRPPGQERVSFFSAAGARTYDTLVPVGGGDFYGLVIQPSTGNLLIASSATDRVYGAVPLEGGGFSEPVLIIPDTTAEPINAAAPTALAFGPDGLLYMGFAGEGSSRIVRIDPETSWVQTLVESDSAVTGIAFRPSDDLPFYAAFGDPAQASGVIYNIDTNGVADVFARHLAGPTALAFDDADVLYVTTAGQSAVGGTGQLLKITVAESVDEEESTASELEAGAEG